MATMWWWISTRCRVVLICLLHARTDFPKNVLGKVERDRCLENGATGEVKLFFQP